MKHIKTNKGVINLDKNWGHLSRQQKDWIHSRFKARYVEYLNEEHRHPNKAQREKILDNVFDDVLKRGIHIPFKSLANEFSSQVHKYRMIPMPVTQTTN